jgi:hypothetical protein
MNELYLYYGNIFIETLMKKNKKSIFAQWFFTTKRHLRSQAPAWCESSGQAALFYSSPDEQINTAKLNSCEVPHEPFSGGSCTPDGGERPTFFISFLYTKPNYIFLTEFS